MKKKKKSNHPGRPPSPDFEVIKVLDEVSQVMLGEKDDRLLWGLRKTLENGHHAILLMLAFISLLLLLFLTLWIGHFLSWIAGIIVGIIGLLMLVVVIAITTSLLMYSDDALEMENEFDEDFADR